MHLGQPTAGTTRHRTVTFWGVRLGLQAVFDVKAHLTAWWLAAGYHVLTALFLGFTLVYGYAAAR